MRTTLVAGDSHAEHDERRFRDMTDRGAPQGARQLTAILPNGRTVWLQVAEPLAPAASVSHLAQLAESTARWRQAGTVAQTDAITRLSKTVIADARRLEEARLRGGRALRRRIDAADNALDTRLSKAREEFRARLDKQLQIDRENARRLRRRDFWDKILIASSLPLFAAYGQQGNPFGANNLTLTLSLLIWLVGDHVVEAVFGSRTRKSPYALHDADAWSYIAPLANALAAWWLLDDRQHQKFVAGVTTVKLENRRPRTAGSTVFYRYRAEVALRDVIGKDHFPDFETFKEVAAVATLRDVRRSFNGDALDAQIEGLSARVEAGVLVLSFRAVAQTVLSPPLPTDLGEVDIAWMVDTERPSPSGSRN